MLAYVFWHWRTTQIDAQSYQSYLTSFHQRLTAHKPSGFITSKVFLLEQAPWLGRDTETYEDWYLIENSAALDPLNEDAVNGQRQEPHNQVARWAAGGTGGLYRLRFAGQDTLPTHFAFWFAKPATMSYAELENVLQPLKKQAIGTLWQRQMTLGPTTEFCYHSPEETALPDILQALLIPMNPIVI